MPANVESMFYVKSEGRPWHGLGKAVDFCATAEEAIEWAGLDWSVEARRIFDQDGKEILDYRAITRATDGTVFNILSDDYVLLQNKQAFTFFDGIVGEGAAIYHTAGSLAGGRIIWLLAKLPGEIVVLGQDKIEKFLLLSNGHDGRRAVQMGFTPIRVVCKNTLNAAISSGQNFYSIWHTGDFETKFREAQRALGIATAWYAEHEQAYQLMAGRPTTPAKVDAFLKALFEEPKAPTDKAKLEAYEGAVKKVLGVRERVKALCETGRGTDLPGVRGTVWGLYNASTEHLDHDYKGSAEGRLRSAWFGERAQEKARAFTLAVDMCKN